MPLEPPPSYITFDLPDIQDAEIQTMSLLQQVMVWHRRGEQHDNYLERGTGSHVQLEEDAVAEASEICVKQDRIAKWFLTRYGIPST